jgi:hypothetical protein
LVGIGLVLADDAEGLHAAVLALEGHAVAELHDGLLRITLQSAGRRAAGRPVAQIAGGPRHGGAVAIGAPPALWAAL